MKYSIALVAAGAAMVAAQDISSLPECGRTCINNMLGIATSQFGCGQNDVLCYCREPNFGYGVRDCANEACGASEASTVIAFGTQYCANALQSASSGVPTTGASALSVLSSAEGADGGANATQASGSGSAESTATVTSTTTGEGNSTETGAAAAGAGISAINGGTSGYAVGSTTITAGGDALSTSGVEFSALPSAAGVLASANGTETTLAASDASALAGAVGAGGIAGVVGAIGAGAAGATDSAGNAISTATDSAGNAISSATDSAASEASDASSSASEGASSAESSATEAASSAQSSGSDAAASATGSSSAGGVMQTAAPALMGAAAMLIMAL